MQSACAVLYCHLWPVRLYHIFPHYFTNCTILGKKVIEHKTCVFIFSAIFVWNISHSKNNSARYYHRCTQVFMQSTRYFCQILTKLEFSPQVFETCSDTKFHENPSSASLFFSIRTDRQTEMMKIAVVFCNFVNAPLNIYPWDLNQRILRHLDEPSLSLQV
jgi:hypothetical protein